MQAHDRSAWPRAALPLALMLGLGLIDSPARHPQASPTIAGEPIAAMARQDAPATPGGSARQVPVARDAAGMQAAACDSACLSIVRQRLLEHHRQAAPVWVF